MSISGSVVAGDLAGALGRDGYTVRRLTAYHARTTTGLPEAVAEALRAETLAGAAFFSPRSAATFARLVAAARLDRTLRPLAGYCLSDAVVRELAAPPWGGLRVAPRPDGEALAGLICADAGRP